MTPDDIRRLHAAVIDAKAAWDEAFHAQPFERERLDAASKRLGAAVEARLAATRDLETAMRAWLERPAPATWDALVAAWSATTAPDAPGSTEKRSG
jgi:hypothetical protein